MAVGAKGVNNKAWRTLRQIKWHQWARLVAVLVLADQAAGTLTALPSSEAIILACIGALFAPVPTEKREQ